MTTHKTGTREDWLASRIELLEREKELTRLSDELSQQRQALPWVPVDKDYRFEASDGTKTLADLFGDRSQLIVFHLMFGPDDTVACPGCSFTADTFEGAVTHLEQHGVAFVAVSRGPIDRLDAYKRRLGWTFPWVSCGGTDFNVDFAVFTEDARRTGQGANFGTPAAADQNVRRDELHGLSAFALEDGVVYHTYSCYDRGTDALNATWQLLDRAPNGRDGAPEGWPRRHDEYERATATTA